MVTVEFNDAIFEFVTDRGEIYCNDLFLCDNSYHIAGKSDTVDKLIEMIQSYLFHI